MVKQLKYRMERRLTFADVDANFDLLAHWSGAWSAGTYKSNEVVSHRGGVWICVNETTEEPFVSTDWSSIPQRGQGVVAQAASVTGPDLGSGWATVPLDSTKVTGVGLTLDPIAKTIKFDWPGLWWISVFVHIEHNESASARNTELRLYNVTKQESGPVFLLPIAKNQPNTVYGLTFAKSALPGELGNTCRFEMGNGSTVTSVVWEQVEISLTQVSPDGIGFTVAESLSQGSGSSSVSGQQHQGTGTSDGAALVSGIGNQEQVPFSAAGTAEVYGVGKQDAASASASGVATATASSPQGSIGSASGSSTAEAEGQDKLPLP